MGSIYILLGTYTRIGNNMKKKPQSILREKFLIIVMIHGKYTKISLTKQVRKQTQNKTKSNRKNYADIPHKK